MRNFLLIILLFAITGAVAAKDLTGKYKNSPYKTWFDSQQNAYGWSCCEEADAHAYYGDYQINPDGSVTADGIKIESEKVLKGNNPTGHAVWWFVGEGKDRSTFCFSPGSLG